MKNLNMNCLTLNNSILYTADEFWKKYYWDDFQMVRIDWEDDCLHYNFKMNDDYWNIDEVYTALWYDIPKKILFEYKEESLDHALRKETFMNLKNFYLMKIGECQKSEQLK